MHLLLLVLLYFTFQSDPLDRLYQEQTLTAVLQEILLTDSPDSAAYKGITQYLLLMSFTEEKLEGKTYRQILELYQLWELQDKARQAREEALAAQEEEREERWRRELEKWVDVSLLDARVLDIDTTIQHYYTIRIYNKSDQTIRYLSGYLRQTTATGGIVLSLEFTFSEPMLPRTTRLETVNTSYKKMDSDPAPQFNKAYVVWQPKEVVFDEK